MTNLGELHKKMDILRKEVKFQKKLADYWDGLWKQKYAKKIDLLRKNVRLEKKYKEKSQIGHVVTPLVIYEYCGKFNHAEIEWWRK